METIGPLIDTLGAKSKQAFLLWLEGVREACCLHRVVIYCRRSRELAIRTGQCFLLNGFIFLGSIFILKSVIIPTLQWILPDQCPDAPCSYEGTLRFYSLLRHGLIQIFYVFWFYPMYIFSFILSNIWYNDIAKHGFFAIEGYSNAEPTSKTGTLTSQNRSPTDKPTDLQGIVIGIAEQVYSLLLMSFFFLEVYITGFVPFVGKAINFVLLSWMYAYYCFEYKWNLSGLSLDKRLDFFESSWPFFAGFGCPCILAIFVFSPLVSYGVMAILYPLFVLTATGSEADKIIALPRRKWKGAGLGRVPIFCAADYLSLRVLSLLPVKTHQQ
ncbi:hypothetical protein M9H77_20930 [Catharanthus roseus]|uniref:Uncharacterized protein n=1 Tax=Catharanthus roseus TaxID=4058 RepID=A0ACC0ANM7_CATRO|nr:hypothetical protein M9H77_20930 [Catharanthus roseus]